MPEEIVPSASAPDQPKATISLPPQLRGLPRAAETAVRELLSLNSKHRSKVLKAFRQPDAAQADLVTSQNSTIVRTEMNLWQGPLPPPAVLAGYNDIISNGAERMLALVEKQQGHRFEVEKQAIKGQLTQSTRGQWFAFVLGLVAMALAGCLAYTGHDWAAVSVAAPTLSGLAISFIVGKNQEKRSRDDKASALDAPNNGQQSGPSQNRS